MSRRLLSLALLGLLACGKKPATSSSSSSSSSSTSTTASSTSTGSTGSHSTASSGSSGASTSSTSSTSSSSTASSGSSSGSSTGSTSASSASSGTSASATGSTGSSASSTGTVGSTGTSGSGSSTGATATGSTGSSGTTACTTTGTSGGTSGGSTGAGGYATVALYDLPGGAALNPTNVCNPGSAAPSQLALVGGKVWTALGNLANFSPAGNSYLASLDPASGALTAFELVGCTNANGLAAHGTDLLVACTGDYTGNGSAVLFDTVAGQVTQTFATGGAPTGVAVVGSKGYLADALFGGPAGVMIVDLTPNAATPVLVSATAETAACDTSSGAYLSSVAAGPNTTEVLALCSIFGGTGTLEVLDPSTGAPLSGTQATTQDGSVFVGVLNSLSGGIPSDIYGVVSASSLQLAQYPTGGAFLLPNAVALPQGSAPNALAGVGGTGFVTLSGVDQVALVDATGSAPVLAATAQLPAGSDPYYAAAQDDRNVWVSLLNTNQLAHLTFAADLDGGAFDAGSSADAGLNPFVESVVSFDAGANGGYNAGNLPGVVQGPPQGTGDSQGSTDVLSLGTGGVIVVRMGEEIVDGPGPDFTVFENAFSSGSGYYTEPGAVAVSDDGVNFTEFPCDPDAGVVNTCAGMHPVYSSTASGISPLDPSVSGGDWFDLSDIGVSQARYVRIRDLGLGMAPQVSPTAGFDLDAVAVIHGQ